MKPSEWGEPVKTLRVPVELVKLIEESMARLAASPRSHPHSWSEWMLSAAREKLAKMERSRRSRRKRPVEVLSS